MVQKEIWFIINPKSGTASKLYLPSLIAKYLDKNKFNHKIIYTEYRGHAKVIAAEAVNNKIDIVVAVGGDGSINEVASSLMHSKTLMGIIALGSGNGLARNLNIPLQPIKAIQLLNTATSKTIDAALVNGIPFFSACGTGFDGYITNLFSTVKKRGLFSYVKLAAKHYFSYKHLAYTIQINQKVINTEALFIAVANSQQFGGNLKIAPKALLDDGLLHTVIIKKFPLWIAPIIVYKGFTGALATSKYVKIIDCTRVIIKHNGELICHFDGEPYQCNNDLDVQIIINALKILA
jgi:diacylglycerol kinase (ATP)